MALRLENRGWSRVGPSFWREGREEGQGEWLQYWEWSGWWWYAVPGCGPGGSWGYTVSLHLFRAWPGWVEWGEEEAPEPQPSEPPEIFV